MKKRLDIEDNPDRWLVSYADFITLMFAFFVVLYATSTRDLEKTKEFQDAVKKYLIKVGAFGGSGEKIEQGEKHNTPIEPPIQTFQNSAAPAEKVYERLLEIVETKIEGRFGEALIDLSGDEMGVRLVMSSPSLFVEKSNLLKEEALPILNAIVALAIELNKKILVEGHAPPDAQPNPWIAGAQQSSQIVR